MKQLKDLTPDDMNMLMSMVAFGACGFLAFEYLRLLSKAGVAADTQREQVADFLDKLRERAKEEMSEGGTLHEIGERNPYGFGKEIIERVSAGESVQEAVYHEVTEQAKENVEAVKKLLGWG